MIAGKGDPVDGLFNLERGEFHGTAFCLTPGIFVTAAHVYQAAAADGTVALARLGPGTSVQLVRDADVFPDVDLALMYCPNLDAEVMNFVFEPLPFLMDVFAIGYAFGSEIAVREGEPHVYHLRAFKGYVVTRRGLTQLPGVPPGYEVSFVPPPGLSGAALLVRQDQDTAQLLAPATLQHATDVQHLGNRVLHGSPCSPDDVFDVLVKTRLVLEALYSKAS